MTVIARTRSELARHRADLQGRVAVVMTMGALHEGHQRLIRTARSAADSVVVTVFVNPLQFGPGEDLDRYPRPLADDLAVCEAEGVDLVFAPGVEAVYPDGDPSVRVSAGELGDRFEGASRPGHFGGVLTVVLKLLLLTRPDIAVYGEKDAQQLVLVRRMVRDLDVCVEIVAVPTVREADGLARASRNRYLTDAERPAAAAIAAALAVGVDHVSDGPDAALAAARRRLAAEPAVEVDYLALVDDDTWHDADRRTRRGRLIVAARIGTTRLIDNTALDFEPSPS